MTDIDGWRRLSRMMACYANIVVRRAYRNRPCDNDALSRATALLLKESNGMLNSRSRHAGVSSWN
jgi:hypothetical protein